jgi:DNA-binding XRE family transcriptional regulator
MAAGRKDGDARGWFADELKAHRAAHGWTQADVAARTNFSESLIAQVETCRKSATPDLARALDRVFETPGFSENPETGEWTPGTFGRLVRRLRKMPFPASFGAFEPREAAALSVPAKAWVSFTASLR